MRKKPEDRSFTELTAGLRKFVRSDWGGRSPDRAIVRFIFGQRWKAHSTGRENLISAVLALIEKQRAGIAKRQEPWLRAVEKKYHDLTCPGCGTTIRRKA